MRGVRRLQWRRRADDAGGAAAGQPELTRAERRALKKKQGAKKPGAGGEDEEEEEDESDLINPNHVTKKLTISDIGAPRELSRRERYGTSMSLLCAYAVCAVSRRRSRRPRSAT